MAKSATKHKITLFQTDLNRINKSIKEIQESEPEGTSLFYMEIEYDAKEKELGDVFVFRTTCTEETDEYENRISKTWKYEDYEITLTDHYETKDIKLSE
tara:strand:- start:1489 stop:1785 length:297 start_codon:yes stop_codon:yes gene_type:complete